MFSELVVAYLFLGGCGAGACAVCAVLGLLVDGGEVREGLKLRFRDERSGPYRRLFTPALAVGLGALALGIVCLAADLGRPDRVLLVVKASSGTYVAVGFWALSLCALLGAVVLAMWQGALGVRRLAVYRLLLGLLLFVAFTVMLYTGLMLGDMASVPLWYGPWLPCIFALSSLSCGVALTVAASVVTGSYAVFTRVVRGLTRLDRVAIALEVVALALWLGVTWVAAGGASALADPANSTNAAALASVSALVTGSWAPLLWGGLAAIGLVVPFVLECLPIRSHVLLVAAMCVLIGGATLRFLVVDAGLQPAAFSMAFTS